MCIKDVKEMCQEDKKIRNIELKWCERGDLNPYPLGDWILNPARLPVPPLSHMGIFGIFDDRVKDYWGG